jgi:antitoxin component YwqK of YwqJK toxin-antitoxin module
MKYIFFISLVTISFALKGQEAEWQPFTREIKIEYTDSIARARIMINPAELKVEDENIYYWHTKGQINKNMGGYSGDILHGVFHVFDLENRMITQGQFDEGLKEGTWKRWYSNGNLKSVMVWKKSRLNGEAKFFSKTGELTKVMQYKDGLVVDKEDKTLSIFKLNSDDNSSDESLTDSLNVTTSDAAEE